MVINFLPSASHVGVLGPEARRTPLAPQPPLGPIRLEARHFLAVIDDVKVKNVFAASIVLACPVVFFFTFSNSLPLPGDGNLCEV